MGEATDSDSPQCLGSLFGRRRTASLPHGSIGNPRAGGGSRHRSRHHVQISATICSTTGSGMEAVILQNLTQWYTRLAAPELGPHTLEGVVSISFPGRRRRPSSLLGIPPRSHYARSSHPVRSIPSHQGPRCGSPYTSPSSTTGFSIPSLGRAGCGPNRPSHGVFSRKRQDPLFSSDSFLTPTLSRVFGSHL